MSTRAERRDARGHCWATLNRSRRPRLPGLQKIVTMQRGAIRHRIANNEGPAGEIGLQLEARETRLAIAGAAETLIQELFRVLVEDKTRTALVCDDVIDSLAEGRRCLVLSQWKDHCRLLADGLRTRRKFLRRWGRRAASGVGLRLFRDCLCSH